MSYKDATDYLENYHTERMKALNNEKRMSWAIPAEQSTTECISKTFGSGDEGEAWETEYNKMFSRPPGGSDIQILRGLKMRVAFLAGCRRDMRMQYAVTDAYRPYTSVDFDRHAYMRLSQVQRRMEQLTAVTDACLKGVENKV
jgi:IS1 family transposase